MLGSLGRPFARLTVRLRPGRGAGDQCPGSHPCDKPDMVGNRALEASYLACGSSREAVNQQTQSGSQPARVTERYPTRPSFLCFYRVPWFDFCTNRAWWVSLPFRGGVFPCVRRTVVGPGIGPVSVTPPLALRGLSLGPDRPRVHLFALHFSSFCWVPGKQGGAGQRKTEFLPKKHRGLGFHLPPGPGGEVESTRITAFWLR